MYLPRNVAVLICLVLTIVVCVSGQDTKSSTRKTHESDCKIHKTCDKCIRTANCQWCGEERPMTHDQDTKSKASGTGQTPRCIDNSPMNIPPEDWCRNNETIINPKANHNGSNDTFSADAGNVTQLIPKKLSVTLRVDKEEKVKIQYKQALGYPVDLYFLMDLSFSMESHRDNLSGLGVSLSEAMRSITSNFRLGFGSFVDKYILPMTSTQPEWLDNYCKLENEQKCATPYDFQHQMQLTSNYSAFKAKVKDAPISGNIDTPEGGLDALMQAMVCDEAIGWRPDARHIIVYSSDATYHIAGDGRLAGLIEPNDELCHLNKEGSYDHAEILDYPSISQIKKIAQEKSKSIIFAVTDTVKTDYAELSEYINPGLGVGTLSSKSDDVVKLVKSFTEKLSSNIKMTERIDDKFAGLFDIKYKAKHTGSIEGVVCNENICSGVSDKTPIEFEVSIKALKCPEEESERHQKIELEIEGIPEKVLIDVDIICSCGCERKVNSEKCSSHGDLACGVCECEPNYQHDNCSCRVDNAGFGDTDKCKQSGSNLTCSGHGSCNSCGNCQCNPGPDGDPGKKYYGDYCECDNFSCPRANINNMPCGGPERGECLCGGKCECKPGYEGESCGCGTQNSCIAPGETEVCGGYGKCECGTCQCTKDNRRSGKYCEQCTICVNQLCDKYKDCVECFAYQTGPKYAEDEKCSTCIDIEFAGKVKNLNETVNGTNYCTLLDSAGCLFAFTYVEQRGDAGKVLVRAEEDKNCPLPPASPWTVALGAIGLTLLLGLIGLIIWKVLTSYYDRREWAKFEKERACAKWERGDNPLFKDPNTHTANPTYQQENTK